MRNKTSENGNILFFILVAVALFAALSYAVTSQNRGSGTASAGSETTLVASSDIIQYASGLENAMTYLRVSKQCTPEYISFERPPFDGSDTDYVNASAPPDFSCHVFHSNGGRVSARSVPPNANDGRDWEFVEVMVLGVGANQTDCGIACNDILLVLGGIHSTTCAKLNERTTGSTAVPVQDDGNNYEDKKYNGFFTTGANIDGDATRQTSLCIEDSNGTNYFYHVLLPR